MSFYIVAGENIIDEFTKPERLVKAYPAFKSQFNAMAKRKKLYEEMKTSASGRDLIGMVPADPTTKRPASPMIAAQIPWPVLAAIFMIDPWFVKDTKRFFKWLNKPKNQIYKIGRYIDRTTYTKDKTRVL